MFEEYLVPAEMPRLAELSYNRRHWSPEGWVQRRREGHRAYFDLHIPKTAGCSFALDAKKLLAEGEGYYSYELCYNWTRPEMVSGDLMVAFVRDPTSHIYSQYLECRFDKEWDVVPPNKKFVMGTLKRWLKHFKAGLAHDHLNCYDPYNMQTRAFVCSTKDGHAYSGEPDLKQAFKNLDSIFFLGIVEHYQASYCLFFAKTQVGQPLPAYCNCRDEGAWKSFQGSHVSHGVPRHSLRDISKESLRLIKELSRLDVQLYEHALARFRREAAEVENRTGTKILCEG